MSNTGTFFGSTPATISWVLHRLLPLTPLFPHQSLGTHTDQPHRRSTFPGKTKQLSPTPYLPPPSLFLHCRCTSNTADSFTLPLCQRPKNPRTLLPASVRPLDAGPFNMPREKDNWQCRDECSSTFSTGWRPRPNGTRWHIGCGPVWPARAGKTVRWIGARVSHGGWERGL